jgi:two-component system sensor histidine kinase PilS (NtrC family)
MAAARVMSALLGKPIVTLSPDIPGDSSELVRMWQGFMTARLTLGLVLLVLQMVLFATSTAHNYLLVAISTAYFAGTLAARVFIRPRPLGHTFNMSWGFVVGMDVLVFSTLQILQGSTVNYTPLFALPILLASVLGSLRLAMGTAASVTVLLLGNSLWAFLLPQSDAAPYFVQSALSGVGYFVIALLGNQLATRLATEAQRAQISQRAIRIQREVNALVIESLPDGVLVVDAQCQVRAANPAARALLGVPAEVESPVFDLHEESGWQPLVQLTQASVSTGEGHEEDVTIWHGDQSPRKVHARTRLAAPHGLEGESLCVLFLQDQRELEARMRTERLASMGRMSTAVAHEIRNPLAAIAQANALLDEDLTEPRLKQLTAMVGQNAKRLAKIVDDILNVSRVQPAESEHIRFALNLNATLHRICDDWATQSGSQHQMQLTPCETNIAIRFDPEHLRRVLVNLLDNAHRYASKRPESIQVCADLGDAQGATISVWSDGAPLDPSIERHLFEPFFSSESRSSGLGLYICRELCDGHGASIAYRRTVLTARGHAAEGNEFVITVVRANPQDNSDLLDLNPTPWQTTLY